MHRECTNLFVAVVVQKHSVRIHNMVCEGSFSCLNWLPWKIVAVSSACFFSLLYFYVVIVLQYNGRAFVLGIFLSSNFICALFLPHLQDIIPLEEFETWTICTCYRWAQSSITIFFTASLAVGAGLHFFVYHPPFFLFLCETSIVSHCSNGPAHKNAMHICNQSKIPLNRFI